MDKYVKSSKEVKMSSLIFRYLPICMIYMCFIFGLSSCSKPLPVVEIQQHELPYYTSSVTYSQAFLSLPGSKWISFPEHVVGKQIIYRLNAETKTSKQVKIAKLDDGTYAVQMEIVDPECYGVVEDQHASKSDNIIHAYRDDGVAQMCELKLTLSGRFLSVEESASCSKARGERCLFSTLNSQRLTRTR